MEQSELLDQQITRSLQNIEANFVHATKVSSSILSKVRAQNMTFRDMRTQFDKWEMSFRGIQFVQNPSQTNDPSLSPMMSHAPSPLVSSSTPQSMSMDSPMLPSLSPSCQAVDNSLCTPTMPKFRTSLAKTPAVLINQNSPFSAASEQFSPPKSTVLYRPSKTPGMDTQKKRAAASRDGQDDEEESVVDSPWLTSPIQPYNPPMSAMRSTRMRGSPLTPMDENREDQPELFGTPVSDSKKFLNRLTYSTKSVAVEKENAVTPSTPQTPTFDSPLAIASLDMPPLSTRKPNFMEQDDDGMQQSCGGTPLSQRVAYLASAKKSAHKTPFTAVKHTPMSIKSAARARSALHHERIANNLLDEEDLEPPAFSLSLFPACFQTGQGAVQISAVYSCFRDVPHIGKEELTLSDIKERLGDYDTFRIELLLDLLVSRRLLYPSTKDLDPDNLYWRLM